VNISTLITSNDQQLQEVTLSIIAEYTEYNIEDLTLTSHLENDLGIDSVFIVDILTSIEQRLKLPTSLSADGLKTIEDIVTLVLQQADVVAIDLAQLNSHAPSLSSASETGYVIRNQVCRIFANHSGYNPADMDLEAGYESDLGIDSVTYTSAVAELLAIFHLAADTELPDTETLAEIVAFFEQVVPRNVVNDIASQTLQGSVADIAIRGTEQPQPNRPSDAVSALDGDPRTMRDFVGVRHPDIFHKTQAFSEFYRKKKANNLYWYGMPLESGCKNRAIIFDEVSGKSREFLMFGSNSYLGLSNHPAVIQAIQDAAKAYGATNTGCRLIAGSNVLHLELERKLAKLKKRDDCIVFPSGYSANLGTISALTSMHDLVFTDAINHMSIQDGCKLSGAQRKIYDHSLNHLEKALARYADHPGGKLIVTDGVFSMHGDIVDLPRLVAMAKRYGARVLVDDAHSTGVLGKTGSGTSEHFNMKGQVDLELGTMSKALSGLGGFVCGDADVIEYLRFYAHSYVFAATIPAHVAAGVIASIDVMLAEPSRLEKLWDNIYYFRNKLLKVGFDLENSDSAIIPIVVGDDQLALAFGRAVRARNMFCQTVVFPGVSVGDARLRISVTSEHTLEDLDEAFAILVDAAQEVGVKINV
jgi:glycine C-acetyltransferase